MLGISAGTAMVVFGVLVVGAFLAFLVLVGADRRRQWPLHELDDALARGLISPEEYERERSELRRVI